MTWKYKHKIGNNQLYTKGAFVVHMVFGQSCCPAAAPALRPTLLLPAPLSGWACVDPCQAVLEDSKCGNGDAWLNKGVETRESRTFHTQPQATAPPPLGVEEGVSRARGRWGGCRVSFHSLPMQGSPFPSYSARRYVLFLPHPQHQNLSLGSDPHHRMWCQRNGPGIRVRVRPACQEKGGNRNRGRDVVGGRK